jgi:FkbM family methyltransferase
LKNSIIKFLQKTLGYKNYLFLFSIFKIFSFKYNDEGKDFFYFLSLIPDGSNVIDIGANLGFVSVIFARKLTKGKVFSFEPDSENFSTLKRTIKLFNLNNIKTFNFALGNEEQKVEMILPVINNVKKQGMTHLAFNESNTEDGIKFSVDMKKLDNIPEILDNNIYAIKIDTENSEFLVLQGSKYIIEKNKPIIYCELYGEENKIKSTEFLINLGYEIKMLKDNSLVDCNDNENASANYFFIPKNKQM